MDYFSIKRNVQALLSQASVTIVLIAESIYDDGGDE
jgi:hypothetical protein